MDLSFSGFDESTSDFESLLCLKSFEIGAYTFGRLDLAQINVNKMPCLNIFYINSWQNNLTGIPIGLNKIKKFRIHHSNLTKAEKVLLNKWAND